MAAAARHRAEGIRAAQPPTLRRPARLDAYHAAEDRILADLPAIPLFLDEVLAVHSERAEGVVVDPLSRINLADIAVSARDLPPHLGVVAVACGGPDRS